MLNIQKYLLKDGTIQTLKDEFGIEACYHPSEKLVILNYNQIDSPRLHNIADECRGLVLELDSWKLISKSFNRFYNIGEFLGKEKEFNWNQFKTFEKLDGSLIQIFYYKNKWIAKTRGSWGLGICDQLTGRTWSELIWEVLDINKVEQFCDKKFSYVLEYTGPYNQVVLWYPEPHIFLLTIFDGEVELKQEVSDEVAKQLEINRPRIFELNTLDQLTSFLQSMFAEGKLDEGFVILDSEGVRWKMKNLGYLAASKLHNNGQIANIKAIVPIVLMGESSEVLATLQRSGGAIYDKVKEKFDEVKITLDAEYSNLVKLHEEAKNIQSQRDFAQYIVPRTKFSSLLFRARKGEDSLRSLWTKSSDLILKVLYNK